MKELISVPEYFQKFIDSKVNLNQTPKVCCPFHNERTPSFSYNPGTGRWRCFGACKRGGDVYDMHMMNYHLRSRPEAIKSLHKMFGITLKESITMDASEPVMLDKEAVELDELYNKCLLKADCPERWVELDYVMSIYPTDPMRLKALLGEWR